MVRPRKSTKEKEPTLTLAKAMAFMRHAQVDKTNDTAMKTHCRLANGYAVAFDGVLAVGFPIDEELNACPHTFRLIDALTRCKTTISITQMETNALVIKSGKFRAVVPCLNPAALPYTMPDPQAGVIDERIKSGFQILNPLVSGTGTTTVEASLLLNNGSMVATDRSLMIEYWHGIDLPNGLAIPKAAINAVCRIPLELTGVGVSDRTVTFYYEGGAWLRTQLYGDTWPNVARVLEGGDYNNTQETPKGLFEAVAAVLPFSDNGAVFTSDDMVSSHGSIGLGATYEIKGIVPGLSFTGKHLLMIKDVVKMFDLTGRDGVSYFFGDNVRGAVSQRKA